MKKIFIFIISAILILSFPSCGKKSEEISINKDNITDYVNIQLIFGNVEQHIDKDEVTYGDNEPNKNIYLTCMCYVYVSPKANYNFENVSFTFDLSKPTGTPAYGYSLWAPQYYSKKVYGVSEEAKSQKTLHLDKNGYGVISILFKRKGDTGHPITGNDWEVMITAAQGKVSNNN